VANTAEGSSGEPSNSSGSRRPSAVRSTAAVLDVPKSIPRCGPAPRGTPVGAGAGGADTGEVAGGADTGIGAGRTGAGENGVAETGAAETGAAETGDAGIGDATGGDGGNRRRSRSCAVRVRRRDTTTATVMIRPSTIRIRRISMILKMVNVSPILDAAHGCPRREIEERARVDMIPD
jgi:hypothetical protein